MSFADWWLCKPEDRTGDKSLSRYWHGFSFSVIANGRRYTKENSKLIAYNCWYGSFFDGAANKEYFDGLAITKKGRFFMLYAQNRKVDKVCPCGRKGAMRHYAILPCKIESESIFGEIKEA